MWLTNLFGKAKNINSNIVDYNKKQFRLKVCGGCPDKRDNFRYLFLFEKKGVKQCSICKCAIDDKVIWEDEKCPKNYWT